MGAGEPGNSPAEQVIGIYERHAREWAADRQGTSFSERTWLERFTALLPPCACVLDAGCGPGKPIAGYFIDRRFDVTGVDSSPTMIALSRASFPHGDWRVADMRSLSLNRDFHGIIAWDSFFHLTQEDQRRTIPIFRRHLAPNGTLMFTSGTSHGEAIGNLRGEPLYHASLSTDEYRSLLADNGFTIRAHVTQDPQCARTVWLLQLCE